MGNLSPIAVIMAQLGPDWTDSYIPADDGHLVRHEPTGLWCGLDDEQINAFDRKALVNLVGLLQSAVRDGWTGRVDFETGSTVVAGVPFSSFRLVPRG